METREVSPRLPRRLVWLFAALLVVVCFALVLWPAVRLKLFVRLVLNSSAPSTEAFDEVVTQSSDPLGFVQRMWAAGGIVHRTLAIGYLRDLKNVRPEEYERIEPLLTAGATDADVSVREQALGALASYQSTKLFASSRAQLADADPKVRLLGVQHLARAEAHRALPVLIKLLDDPDLCVVATVESALKKWTGQDFGVKIAQAIPRDGLDGIHYDPANVEAIKRAVEQRKEWWQEHARDYELPEAAALAMNGPPAPRTLAADFRLPGLDGSSVRLSDFRGKIVLLNFWTTWCPACLTEIPDLIELQKNNTNRLVILGISLDGVPEQHGHEHREGSEEHEHSGDHEKADAAALRAKVERFVKSKGINYPVLLDTKNAVGARFNGGELPTNVLIDSEGNVRRRFIGARSRDVLEAMISEINRSAGAVSR